MAEIEHELTEKRAGVLWTKREAKEKTPDTEYQALSRIRTC